MVPGSCGGSILLRTWAFSRLSPFTHGFHMVFQNSYGHTETLKPAEEKEESRQALSC